MSGAITRKAVKDVTCEEWGWVAGRVVSFCNLDVTEVFEFGSGVSTRALGLVVGDEEGSDRNMTTNNMYKAPSKNIFISHYLVTYVNNSEMTTQKFLRPETNHWHCLFIFEYFFRS